MTKHYSIDEKISVLKRLDANGGSIGLTVSELGIRERTLRDWNEFRQAIGKAFFTPEGESTKTYPYPKEELDKQEDSEVVKELQMVRDKMMGAIRHLMEKLDVEDGMIPQRAMAFSRLIDRLNKVDEQIIAWRKINENKIYLIEYLYPDGKVYDRPIWESEEYIKASEGYPDGQENARREYERAMGLLREDEAQATDQQAQPETKDKELGYELTDEDRMYMERERIIQEEIDAGLRGRHDFTWYPDYE